MSPLGKKPRPLLASRRTTVSFLELALPIITMLVLSNVQSLKVYVRGFHDRGLLLLRGGFVTYTPGGTRMFIIDPGSRFKGISHP